MKKKIFRIIALVLCVMLCAGMTVSAKSSDSFIHYQTLANITAIGRDMYVPTQEITDYSIYQDLLKKQEELNPETPDQDVEEGSEEESEEEIEQEEILEGATDIFAKDGYIYVLNGANSRLFVLNSDLSFNREIIIKTADGTEESYTEAANIFIDRNNVLYLSDTKGERLIICDIEGNVKTYLTLPDSEIIPDDFLYQPTSVVVDYDGNVYVLSLGSFYGALLFSPEYEFKGFYGANTVQYTALDALSYIWDLLTNTDAKRAQSERVLPYAFNDINIDKQGYLYTVTAATSTTTNTPGQVSMLSPNGINILYKRDPHGASVSSSGVQFAEGEVIRNVTTSRVQNFIGIAIDSSEFIHILDSRYGLIYMYDSDCNLISAYGGGVGQGNQLGLFKNASAITINGDNVLVLDAEKMSITVFEPTEYGNLVHEAQPLYLAGNYVEAKTLWEEILAMDSNSVYAYRGLAKANYVEGNYDAAIKYAELSYDYATYDNAFQQVRNNFINDNFTWVFFGLLLALVGFIVLVIYFKKREKALISNVKIHTLFSTLVHPFDAFKDIKYKKHGSGLIAAILIVLFTVSSVLKDTGSSFLFRTANPSYYNALFTLAKTVGLVLLWVICNYLASVLMQGKGTFKEIVYATSYALLPVIAGNFINTILSYVLTYDDVTFMTAISTVTLIYTGYLLFIGLTTMHDYGMGKFLLNTVVALFFMILVVFILFMVGIMLQQLFTFIVTLYMEVAYR